MFHDNGHWGQRKIDSCVAEISFVSLFPYDQGRQILCAVWCRSDKATEHGVISSECDLLLFRLFSSGGWTIFLFKPPND